MTAAAPAPRARKTVLKSLERIDGEIEKRLLPLQVTSINRYTILELARIGAGLSYLALGKRAGLPGAVVARILRGHMKNVRGERIHRLWSVLWEALPSTSTTAALEVLGEEIPDTMALIAGLPAYLTLDEAAALLKLSRAKLRRLVVADPRLRAVKIGSAIRIPRSALNDFIVDPRPAVARRNGPGMTVREVTALFRVSQDVIRYAVETGRLKVEQAGRYGRVRIPVAEVQRIAKSGLVELKPHKYWHRPELRKKHCRPRHSLKRA